MAPCTSTNCKKREEELLANQMEQRRLLTSQVVAHAAKVATANTNLLKGILESCGGEGEALSEEVSLAVISTLKAEIDAKKRAIVQSNSNLQQRERMFSHPLNDNRSMMSVGELHEWRGVHRRLEVVEGRRVKELEKEIIRVALGRDMEVAGGGNSVEDQESSLGIAEELLRRKPTIEEEEVLTVGLAMRMRNMRMMRIMRICGICGICGCVCGLKISSTLYTYEYLPKMATFWARNGSAWLCFQF